MTSRGMTGGGMTDDQRVADALVAGDVIEVRIGPVAHGGHCVARYHGRVIFVRHALPGELVRARITEVKRHSFCRGDAVTVLEEAPGRVRPRCVHFHPGGCGGCDFQHASAQLQRELKAAVVTEQLLRLAGLDVPVVVESLDDADFGWRTRVRWALDPTGRIGPRAFRSHRVVGVNPAEPCLIAAPGLTELAATVDVPTGVRRPTAEAGPRTGRPLRARTGGDRRANRTGRPELPEVLLTRAGDGSLLAIWPGEPGRSASPAVTERALGREFEVAADGFWQVHPAAADALAGAVGQALDGIELTGRDSWDLYSGVGLFTEVLARAVGPSGSVVAVEGDRRACVLAEANMASSPQVSIELGSVESVVPGLAPAVDAVVLDPPRAGAGPELCAAIAARNPAVIVYVACDPAALARDTAALTDAGYRLASLRAFDAFPQTHHVECVAAFRPA